MSIRDTAAELVGEHSVSNWDDFAELLLLEADDREEAADSPLSSILRYYPGFRWGDKVWVAENAPEELRPGHAAEVYGAIRLNTREKAQEHEGEAGEWLYMIEYACGASATVPGELLSHG